MVEFWILWCFREKVVFMGYYGRNPGKIDAFWYRWDVKNAINKGAVEVIIELKMVDLRSNFWSWRVDGTHSQYLADRYIQ